MAEVQAKNKNTIAISVFKETQSALRYPYKTISDIDLAESGLGTLEFAKY